MSFHSSDTPVFTLLVGISGEGNGNPLQHSSLEDPTDRETWQASLIHGVARVGHNLETKTPLPRLSQKRGKLLKMTLN